MVDNILGTKTPSLVPGNIEAFDKSLQAWNLGIGTPTASAATTPAAAPKVSLSQQAPIITGKPEGDFNAPSNETVAKPVTAGESAGSGILPKTTNDIYGYKAKTGENVLTNMPSTATDQGIKPKVVLNSRLGIGGEQTTTSPAYKAIQDKITQLESLPKVESPGSGQMGIPKSRLAAITELYKELGTVEGHGIAAKERGELTKLSLADKQERTEALKQQNKLMAEDRKSTQKLNELKDWETRYSDVDPMTGKASFSGVAAVTKSLLEGLEVPSRYKSVETKVLETIKPYEKDFDNDPAIQAIFKKAGISKLDPRYIEARRKKALTKLIQPPPVK
jgi:hypothetical protein